MPDDDIRELLKVHLKVFVAREGEDDFYVSSVQDIDKNAIFIGMPMSRSLSLVLSRGENLQVRFTKEDASYFFRTSVTRVREDEIPLYGLAWPQEVERKQLRRHVRLGCLLDVEFAEAPSGSKTPAWHKGRAVDISAGGLKLQTDRVYDTGTLLMLRFALPLRQRTLEIETQARVVRKETEDPPPGTKSKPIRRYGLEFLDLPVRRQDEIMSFIFWKMAENRRVT
ncbi:MAG: PilZ domain-containing protein [Thermoanaerobacterales bacterium]|nr:PilZ domain-containing protein [Bacillota bacterium]MDI6906122.1 PilZ domain-containing protein [Thermoanaerobacterales bacterium]